MSISSDFLFKVLSLPLTTEFALSWPCLKRFATLPCENNGSQKLAYYHRLRIRDLPFLKFVKIYEFYHIF